VQANARPTPEAVTVTVPVALSDVEVPPGTKVGIVLTLGQGAEGSEWAEAAQGAEIAKYRLDLGGTEIGLAVEDDHGTASGARDAVTALAKKGVAGIVLASAGPHLADAVDAASEAGVPVLLPYAPLPADAPKGAWSFAPTDTALVTAMNDALDRYARPVLLNVGGSVPDGLHVAETMEAQGADLAVLATAAAAGTGADLTANGAYVGGQEQPPASSSPGGNQPKVDVLVIAGAPTRMAEMVALLQARQVTVPIMLTPAASSPAFAQTLTAKGGTASSTLRTFGLNTGDSAALGRTDDARAMSAFLQALTQFSADGNATNLTGDAAFAQVAPWADTRAHDAVLALAHAAASAGDSDPSRVSGSIGGMRIGAGSGVAGPTLDFSAREAATGTVQTLYATGQSLGLRPAAADVPELTWFPEPRDEG